MAISMKKYVDIVSGVGGNNAVRQRDLIGRMFTTNPLVPTKSFIEFDSAEDVGLYFGTTSVEYLRAAHYFSFISKNISKAKKLSFARWVNAAAAPRIYGKTGQQAYTSYTGITAGAFQMSIGGVAGNFTGINFAAALSLSDVASILQTKIRTGPTPQYNTATVTWDAVRQSFNFVGAFNQSEVITVTAGVSNDVAGQLGWLDGAILSNGADAETLTQTLTLSADASNNFGSFLFLPTLTLEQWQEVGLWNTNQNVAFMGMVPVTAANQSAWSAGLLPYWGMALTLSPIATEYPEQIPMTILAATNYNKRNAVQNYMFQIFPLVTPSINTTLESNALDALRINYYGQTQTAGQQIQFYQRGLLMGQGQAPVDQNVYANEMWLKDSAAAAIMSLLLSLSRVSANATGRSQLTTTLQSVVNQALFNGTISVGKPLNITQKEYITDITGDDNAWHQVQGIGYWLDVVVESYLTPGPDSRTEWKAVYTLIYSKDDAIRKVDGTHILI